MKTVTICVLAVAALAASGCARHREFRVAYVGSEPYAAADSADGGPSHIAPGAPLIVASGNMLLGPASQLVSPAGGVPTSGVVEGTVSLLLPVTDQMLVQLDDGSAVILDGTGAAPGEVVSIDLGTGIVISGPSSLVGASVSPQAATTGGQLASVSVGESTATISPPSPGLPTPALPTPGLPSASLPKLGPTTGTVTGTSPVSTAGSTVQGILGGLCC